MKTTTTTTAVNSCDPWSTTDADAVNVAATSNNNEHDNNCSFEDSFISSTSSSSSQDTSRLPDSEQYLARLHSRLKSIQGGTSKRDLINSLSVAKEDCIARLITNGQNLETEEEKELAANPLIRHIAPHLQALTANELVHLLKADALQAVVDEQNGEIPENKDDTENKSTDSSSSLSDSQAQDTNGL